MFADGPVMPRPDSRPVAQESGHARIASTPMIAAVTNGCHAFSVSTCARPVLAAGSRKRVIAASRRR